MRVPRGVAKSDEEKWTKDTALGTPHEDVCQEDRSVTHLTRKGPDDRYELNRLRTVMDVKPG